MDILKGNCLTLGWHSGKFRDSGKGGRGGQKSLGKHLQPITIKLISVYIYRFDVAVG